MIYKHQFCLSHEPLAVQEDCHLHEISNYNLKYHDSLSFSRVQNKKQEIIILGDIYSYQNPRHSNEEIAQTLITSKNRKQLFKALEPYCGAYVILWRDDQALCIIPDAAAQREVFYNEEFSFFASQVGLFPEFTHPKAHPYYSSVLFDTKRIYIGDTTPDPTIRRLLPNHYLDTLSRKCKRFHPISENKSMPIDEVAKTAAYMLKGFIAAIHHRHEIVIPVTAGYDSRMLFLASLPLTAEYYISQHEGMADDHYEITIAKKIVSLFGKKLQVVKDGPEDCYFASEPHGVDYPRDMSFPKLAKGKVVINGNVSEVARNAFDYHQPTEKNLRYLTHFGNNSFVKQVFVNWLRKNSKYLRKLGYHPLDFFYWEENTANWAAKGKSETRVLDVEMISPFNSRGLLDVMHSTDRNARDRVSNVLHHKIMGNLTTRYKEVSKIPINPDFERKRARLLWKLGLFKIFEGLRIKARLAKAFLTRK